jgi:type IV pilus assembly protein PilP
MIVGEQTKHDRAVRGRAYAVLGLALALTACGGEAEEPALASRGFEGAAPAKPGGTAAAAGAPAEGGAAAAPAAAPREPVAYKDEDFVESVSNRDPFKIYTTQYRADLPEGAQRRVYMPTTAVEEMRLIAIVTGVAKPKAMLVDPVGVGHVVERGDYVGRPKVIQASGNVAMTLNWRVDRIRDNEVVLTQEDATDPTRIAMTKIIPLREEGEVQ